LFTWIKNGILPFLSNDPMIQTTFIEMIYPLLLIAVGGFTSWIAEAFYLSAFMGKKTIKDLKVELKVSFPLIPGILIAMIVPLYTPIWVLVLGCLFATIIGKMLFGGFGFNLFNPAILGYVFIGTAFSGVIADAGGYLNTAEAVVSAVTPLQNFAANPGAGYDVLVGQYGGLWNFFLGNIPGSMSETSSLLIIMGFTILAIRGTVSWRIPVMYVGTFFVLTLIIGLSLGHGLWYPLFNLFSGGLMFGALFMASEPVTSPKSPNGKIIYGVALGIFTVLFRLVGNFPEGVATSILLMNLFTPMIDRFASAQRAQGFTKKTISKYAFLSVFFLLLAVYTISASVNKATPSSEANAIVEVLE
jgi:electron transport complex protein RnfD